MVKSLVHVYSQARCEAKLNIFTSGYALFLRTISLSDVLHFDECRAKKYFQDDNFFHNFSCNSQNTVP